MTTVYLLVRDHILTTWKDLFHAVNTILRREPVESFVVHVVCYLDTAPPFLTDDGFPCLWTFALVFSKVLPPQLFWSNGKTDVHSVFAKKEQGYTCRKEWFFPCASALYIELDFLTGELKEMREHGFAWFVEKYY
jgi:hypothetical protein